MATEGGGKIKPKRGHSSSKPYERRKSLLGKVTDTVKDLLAPSWLTDFVSNVSKKTPPKDRKDTLIEEEDDIFMSPSQSPSQLNCVRKPVSAPPPPLHPSTTTTDPVKNAVPLFYTPTQPPFSSSQLPFSKFGGQKPRQQNDDALSEKSDASTSGCSSMIPHPDKQAYQREILQLNDSALESLKTDFRSAPSFQPKKADHISEKSSSEPKAQIPSSESKLTDRATNPPRTWTAELSRQGRHLAPAVRDQPSFNASLFGSPVLNQSSSILGGSFGESSFYAGKTTYGGASAYRKLNNTAPYQTALPIRKQLKPKPQNNSFNAVTSSTARRILETLERMSTPLTDAKKMPSNESYITDSVLSFTPGSYRRRTSLPLARAGSMRRSLEVPMKGPPTSQLKTPSIASISKNRQRSIVSTSSSSRVAETKEKQRQDSMEDEKDSDQSHEDEPIVIDERPPPGGRGGKMMREKSYHNRRPVEDDDDDVVEMPSLKTDFTLPVASLPSFNFTSTSTVSKQGKPVSTSGKNNKADAPSLKFTFSSPIQKSSPHTESMTEATSGFKFSSPLKVSEDESVNPPTVSAVGDHQQGFKPVMNSTLTDPFTKLGNGGIGMNFKKSEKGLAPGHGQGFKPASELKEGSVMDILGGNAFKPASDLRQGSVMSVIGTDSIKTSVPSKTSKTSGSSILGSGKSNGDPVTFSGLQPASQLKQGSVMDILGSKDNSLSTLKPASDLKQGSVMDILGKKDTKVPAASDDLMAKFRKPKGNWDCDTCLVQNKGESSKCVACGTSKPGSGPQLPPPVTTPSTPVDLLAKPGSSATVPQLSSAAGGSISTGQPSLSSMFKTPTGSWTCDTCMVSNKSEDVKCVACQLPKPGATVEDKSEPKSGSKPCLLSAGGNMPGGDPPSFKFGGGFNFGKTADSKPPESGFKLGSGFNFGIPSSEASDSKPVSDVGVSDSLNTFSNSNSKTLGNPGAGFSFGSVHEKKPVQVSDSPLNSNNAFKVNTDTTTSASTTSGSIFGGLTSGPSVTSATTVSSDKDKSKGGFDFGQKSDAVVEKKDATTSGTAISKPGGFAFGQSGTTSTTPSTGGFTFGITGNTTETSKPETKSVTGGFSFAPQDTVKLNSIPSFGTAAATATESKTSSNSLFTFGQPVANADNSKPLGAGGFAFTPTSDGIASKRGRDEETGAPSAKKSFTFGQSSAAAPTAGFNFSGSTSATTASSVFTFGAASGSTASTEKSQPSAGFSFGSTAGATAAAVTGTTSTPSFSFGTSQPAGNASFPVFGQPTTTASSMFQFGSASASTQSGFGAFGSSSATSAPFGKSNTLPQPVFGNTANSNPQTPATGGVFGNTVSSFGTNNSATPAPSFGSTDQNANTGGFSFKMGATGSQSTGSVNSTSGFNFGGGGGGVFQFSAKNNEVSAGAPAQGSASSVFAFGSTQQPQPAAPAPSFNTSNTFGGFTGNTGGFTIGSNPDSGRKIKRAVRKIKK